MNCNHCGTILIGPYIALYCPKCNAGNTKSSNSTPTIPANLDEICEKAYSEIWFLGEKQEDINTIKQACLTAIAANESEAVTALRIIGDMAAVDWDDATFGKVDAVVKTHPPQTYIEKVRNLYKRADDARKAELSRDQLKAEVERLKACLPNYQDRITQEMKSNPMM